MGRTTLALIVLVVAVAQLSEAKGAAHSRKSALLGKMKRHHEAKQQARSASGESYHDLTALETPAWFDSLYDDQDILNGLNHLKRRLGLKVQYVPGKTRSEEFDSIQTALDTKLEYLRDYIARSLDATAKHIDEWDCSLEDVLENECNFFTAPPRSGFGGYRRTLDSANEIHNVLDLLKKNKMQNKK